MYVFDIQAVRRALEAQESNWKEFLRVDTLSLGVYRLRKGERDEQRPHTEDEVYFIRKGRASFVSGDNVQDVGEGSVIYVEANREHRFADITEDIEALVLFTPPEGSTAGRE